MKVLVTGATGMLGQDLCKAVAARGWEVAAMSRAATDPSRPDSFVPVIRDHDVLIHAAANTDVEACEADLLACYRDNALMTESLALAARTIGVRVVYISSTGVYGDHGTEPYHEYDAVRPTTHHHRAKRAGEIAVLRHDDALVVRAGWIFGGDTANPKNFVARRIVEAAHSPSTLRSNVAQRGCPTYSCDLASRITELIASDFSGVFNCVNEGTASRFEYVREIVRLYGLEVEVQPSPAKIFSRKAKVSDNEMAINLRQELHGLPRMRDWRDALAEYIQAIRLTFKPG